MSVHNPSTCENPRAHRRANIGWRLKAQRPRCVGPQAFACDIPVAMQAVVHAHPAASTPMRALNDADDCCMPPSGSLSINASSLRVGVSQGVERTSSNTRPRAGRHVGECNAWRTPRHPRATRSRRSLAIARTSCATYRFSSPLLRRCSIFLARPSSCCAVARQRPPGLAYRTRRSRKSCTWRRLTGSSWLPT